MNVKEEKEEGEEATGSQPTTRGERFLSMLKTKQWSDCSFIVGQDVDGQDSKTEVIAAHKIILAAASPIFGTMFFGSLPEARYPIAVTDIEPDAFKSLLEFIYSGSFENKLLDHAWAVLYAGKKYMLPDLMQQCGQIVTEKLTISNVCKSFEMATALGETNLVEECSKYMKRNAEFVLSDDSFKDVDRWTLRFFLASDSLNISSELALFNACHRWAIQKCKKQSCEETMTNLRRVIGADLLQKVRFLTFTPEQFSSSLAQAALLTEKEAMAIFWNISNISNPRKIAMPKGFSEVVNCREMYQRSHCVLNSNYRTNSTTVNCGDRHTISFVVNKTVWLWGIVVSTKSGYTSSKCKYVYSAGMRVFVNAGCRQRNFVFNSPVNENSEAVIKFPEPCCVRLEDEDEDPCSIGIELVSTDATGAYYWGEKTLAAAVNAANGVQFRIDSGPTKPIKSIIFTLCE